MTDIWQEIMKLDVDERILLVQAIWDSIPQEQPPTVADDVSAVLMERRAEYLANPEGALTWEEVKKKLQAGV